MGGHYLRKYGVATTLNFELYQLDGSALKSDAVSATHDIKIMKDEGAEADTTADAFVDEGQGYSLALSATEMEAARIVIYIVDQTSPQAWLDKVLIVETYGNASAQHAFDLDTATVDVSAASVTSILSGIIEGTLTLQQAIMLCTAAAAGKLSGGGTSTLTFRDTTDTKNRIVATVDGSGNRTAITKNVT